MTIGMRRTLRAAVLGTALLLALPASGLARLPPEDDGSTFTWPGATTVTVDVEPWGGGYVQSTPYLIDCPLACIRPFDAGREVTFTAYPTPGFTFESWTDACEGQPNPCTLTTSGAALGVVAVFSGHYVPPSSPSPPGPTLSGERHRGPAPDASRGPSGRGSIRTARSRCSSTSAIRHSAVSSCLVSQRPTLPGRGGSREPSPVISDPARTLARSWRTSPRQTRRAPRPREDSSPTASPTRSDEA